MDRRDFIRNSLLVAGNIVATGALGANILRNEENRLKKSTDMDYVTLNNGVRMPCAWAQSDMSM